MKEGSPRQDYLRINLLIRRGQGGPSTRVRCKSDLRLQSRKKIECTLTHGGLGTFSERTGLRSRPPASRAVSGAPRDQRSRSVRITEVWRYSSLTTVREGIHAEIAMAGSRWPNRLNMNPI